jgi:hypothetical protein
VPARRAHASHHLTAQQVDHGNEDHGITRINTRVKQVFLFEYLTGDGGQIEAVAVPPRSCRGRAW